MIKIRPSNLIVHQMQIFLVNAENYVLAINIQVLLLLLKKYSVHYVLMQLKLSGIKIHERVLRLLFKFPRFPSFK